MSDSITREEQYLNAIANGESIDLKPITREEQFLAKAAGQNVRVPTPITRKEKFLSKISGTGGGKLEQEKKVEITKNGTTEIFPDEGYTLSKVTANVNVSASGGVSKLAQLAEGTLTEITAEDLKGITEIRRGAFYFYNGAKFLESVTIGDNITKIEENAFRDNRQLATVTIGKGIKYIGYNVFASTNITRVNIDSIDTWCNISFSNGTATPVCRKGINIFIKNATGEYEPIPKEIVIPNTVTGIKAHTFYRWESVESFIIPESVTGIGSSVFQDCISLTTLTIPNSVTSIGASAFEGCSNLTSLTIPSSVTKLVSIGILHIGSETNKATITFLQTTPPSISTSLFKVEYLEKIIVPKGCGEAYKTATNWANFADLIEEAAE